MSSPRIPGLGRYGNQSSPKTSPNIVGVPDIQSPDTSRRSLKSKEASTFSKRTRQSIPSNEVSIATSGASSSRGPPLKSDKPSPLLNSSARRHISISNEVVIKKSPGLSPSIGLSFKSDDSSPTFNRFRNRSASLKTEPKSSPTSSERKQYSPLGLQFQTSPVYPHPHHPNYEESPTDAPSNSPPQQTSSPNTSFTSPTPNPFTGLPIPETPTSQAARASTVLERTQRILGKVKIMHEAFSAQKARMAAAALEESAGGRKEGDERVERNTGKSGWDGEEEEEFEDIEDGDGEDGEGEAAGEDRGRSVWLVDDSSAADMDNAEPGIAEDQSEAESSNDSHALDTEEDDDPPYYKQYFETRQEAIDAEREFEDSVWLRRQVEAQRAHANRPVVESGQESRNPDPPRGPHDEDEPESQVGPAPDAEAEQRQTVGGKTPAASPLPSDGEDEPPKKKRRTAKKKAASSSLPEAASTPAKATKKRKAKAKVVSLDSDPESDAESEVVEQRPKKNARTTRRQSGEGGRGDRIQCAFIKPRRGNKAAERCRNMFRDMGNAFCYLESHKAGGAASENDR